MLSNDITKPDSANYLAFFIFVDRKLAMGQSSCLKSLLSWLLIF
ncbi:hypothetical protein VVMO6_01970 [Vibrio vulnificus MO6-24/O]|nr:hypothetical protein VVMO6_01970 [Vibrio vulnificus MO6-24/O]